MSNGSRSNAPSGLEEGQNLFVGGVYLPYIWLGFPSQLFVYGTLTEPETQKKPKATTPAKEQHDLEYVNEHLTTKQLAARKGVVKERYGNILAEETIIQMIAKDVRSEQKALKKK